MGFVSRTAKFYAFNLTASEIAAGVFLAWFLYYVILKKYLAVRSMLSALKECPGGTIIWQHPFRTVIVLTSYMFSPRGWLASWFEKYFPRGWVGCWFERFAPYARAGSTCLSSVTFWDALPVFWLSDADTIRTVLANQDFFLKDIEAYEALKMYGPTIIAIEGSDWKRHRSVISSAFNDLNSALVWRETFRVMNDWFVDIDGVIQIRNQASVDLLQNLMKVNLLVITRAGFGRQTSWKELSNTVPIADHERTFGSILTSTLKYFPTKIVVPGWVIRLSSDINIPGVSRHLTETRNNFESLRIQMLDGVASTLEWISQGRTTHMDASLLRNVVEANVARDFEGRLSDDELLSNAFSFIGASYETSAHTLCFAILLLALYPDIQERAHEETCMLWPEGLQNSDSSPSSKESLSQLGYISAIFNETLRLFTPVPCLSKTVVETTSLQYRRFCPYAEGMIGDVEEHHVRIPAGSLLLIDIMALHMNPIHWGEDPGCFKPDRFIDTKTYRWPRDAFQAFSSGPRNCVGRTFANTECVSVLAQLVRKYEICVPDELRDKPFIEQKEIMLKWKPGFTLVPLNAKVVFRPRT